MLNLHIFEKIVFIHFPEDVQKNCCFKSFKKIIEKRLQKSSFKGIWAFQSTLHKYTENCLHRNCFMWVFPSIFKIAGRASVLESHL